MKASLVVAAGLLAVCASAGSAQVSSPVFSAEGAGLYATVNGDDFDGTDAGMGFDVQGRVRFASLSIGAGYQRTSHGTEFTSENGTLSGFFVEPRYGFAGSGSFRPYISAKLGRVTQSLEADFPEFGPVEQKSSGFLYGFGGGLEFPVSPAVAFNVGASYNRVSFGDLEINGETLDDSDSSGSSVMLRVGLGFAFPRR
jgi:opacity protein-like surface antigen